MYNIRNGGAHHGYQVVLLDLYMRALLAIAEAASHKAFMPQRELQPLFLLQILDALRVCAQLSIQA